MYRKRYIVSDRRVMYGWASIFIVNPRSWKLKWFDRGFVTYSNNSKIDSLGVQRETLENFGAVSQEVANEMSTGALKNSEANLGISITGIAGPEGGSLTKPVGTVYFSIANQEKVILEHKSDFDGSRETIRKESVLFVLNKLLNLTL